VKRDGYVDLIRVVAIVVVVVGHWATTSVIWDESTVANVNALSVVPWTRVLTWVVQVMPLVFFIGGFANARSLQQAGGDALRYLRTRLGRLMVPTLLFLAVWQVLALVAEWIDPASSGKERVAETAALPLWFLGIYLVAVVLAPTMWRLHRRFGLAVVLVLAAAVAVVDLVSIGYGLEDLGGLNYAFLWLLAHQAGFLYADGTLQRWGRGAAAGMTGAGLTALVVLTAWGGYPVSLVGVPGQARSNAQPPSLAMLAGVVWLIGLAVLLRPSADGRPRNGKVIAVIHGAVLTIYLWHVTAMSAGAALWRVAGMPDPEIDSAGWWALRPVWVLFALPALLVLIVLFRRFEIHPRPGGPPGDAVRLAAAGFGVVAVAVGVLGYGETGFLPFAPEVGESILVFRFTPLQNLFHLGVGAAALAGAFGPRMVGVPAAAGAAAFVVVGVLGERLTGMGMNGLTASAHVVIGAIGLAGLVAAAARRAVRPSAPSPG
jgi:surface polysaccharide O-acyltransferase-like enzyme